MGSEISSFFSLLFLLLYQHITVNLDEFIFPKKFWILKNKDVNFFSILKSERGCVDPVLSNCYHTHTQTNFIFDTRRVDSR